MNDKPIKVIGGIFAYNDHHANLDVYYGPYTTEDEAKVFVSEDIREIGLTVGILLFKKDNNGLYVYRENLYDETTESHYSAYIIPESSASEQKYSISGIVEYWWKEGVEPEQLVKKVEGTTLTIDYVDNLNLYSYNEGDILTILFRISGTFPASEVVVRRSIDGISFSEYKRQRPVSGINTVQIYESQLGTSATYSILVIDVLNNYAVVANTDGQTTLNYTVLYGKVNININTFDLDNSLINENTHNIPVPVEVTVANKILPYNIKILLLLEGIISSEQFLTYNGSNYSTVLLNNITGNLNMTGELLKINNFPTPTLGNPIHCTFKVTVTYDGDNFIKEIPITVINSEDFDLELITTSVLCTTIDRIYLYFKVISGNAINVYNVKAIVPGTYYGEEEPVIFLNDYPGNTQLVLMLNPIHQIISEAINIPIYILYGEVQKGPYNVSLTISEYLKKQRTSEGLVAEFTSPTTDIVSRGNGKFWNNTIQSSPLTCSIYGGQILEEELSNLQLMYGLLLGNYEYASINTTTAGIIPDADYTVELYFKSTYVGKDSMVFNGGLRGASILITHSNVTINDGVSEMTLDIPNDEWVHIVAVYRVPANNLEQGEDEDKYPKGFSGIYINGVICSAQSYTTSDIGSSVNSGYIINRSNDIYGNASINTIRIYKRALLSSEIYNNYLNCLTLEEANLIEQKNNINIPKISFININTQYIAQHNTNIITIDGKLITLVDFNNLRDREIGGNMWSFNNPVNYQTNKDLLKTTGVLCRVLYDGSNIQDDQGNDLYALVTTLGTSTLIFPVKNYKIVFYDSSFNKVKVMINSSILKEKESKFTLKADYMDSSHLNNTPTCMWYNKVVDELFSENEKSPAKKNSYFDAIKGMPCIVEYKDGSLDVFHDVGSYMFNIDKSGNSLGFKLSGLACLSFEGKANDSFGVGAFKNPNNLSGLNLKDALSELFETRFSYDDNEDLGKKQVAGNMIAYPDDGLDWGSLDKKGLGNVFHWGTPSDDVGTNDNGNGFLRMWTWVENSVNLTKEQYKQLFEKVFSLSYCLLYYVQMIVFGLVDNPGKNCMWDTWDGKKWYPRPYDLDSELGLNNNGQDIIQPFTELHRELSLDYDPLTETPESVESTMYPSNPRYLYNTRGSRMWLLFAKHYKDEIDDFYARLRNSRLYTPDNIILFFKSTVIDVLGERYYNKDFVFKYLPTVEIDGSVANYINVCTGNRWNKFKTWLNQRFIFCDTLFRYNSNIDYIEVRSGVANNMSLSFDIYTRSPLYIRFSQGNNAGVTVFCKDYQTIEWQFESNVDYRIQGRVDNITKLHNINRLKLQRMLTLYPLSNLLELDCSDCGTLESLNIGLDTRQVPYLLKLNISNTNISGTLYIPKLSTLIIATNSKILQLNILNDSNIEVLDLKNTGLQRLTLSKLPYLTNVDLRDNTLSDPVLLEDLPRLTTLLIDNCKFLNTITLLRIPISELLLDNATFQNSLYFTNLDNLSSLSMLNTTSTNAIDLSSITNLSSLNLQNSHILLIIVPGDSSNSNNISTLLLGSSDLINLGPQGSSSDGINMISCKNLSSSFTFKNASKILKIKNFTWNNSGVELFRNCIDLVRIESSNINIKTSANSMFRGCEKLKYINNVTLQSTGADICTTMEYGFYGTHSLPMSHVLNIIKNTKLTSINYLKANTMFPALYDEENETLESSEINLTNLFGSTPLTTAVSSFGYTQSLNTVKTSDNEVVYMRYTKITGQLPTSITNCNSMFERNTSLTSISTNIISGLTGNVNCHSMFGGCTSLNITVPDDFFPIHATNISKIFSNTKVTKVFSLTPSVSTLFSRMGNSLTTANCVFENCTNVSGVIDGLFIDNESLSDVERCFSRTSVGSNGGLIFYVSTDPQNPSPRLKIGGLFGLSAGSSNRGSNILISSNSFSGLNLSGVGAVSTSYGGSTTQYGLFLNRNILFIESYTLELLLDVFSLTSSFYMLFRYTNIDGIVLNSFPDLSTFTNITNTSYMFSNSNIVLTNPECNLNLPPNVLNASNMYENTGIIDFDTSSFNNKQALSNIHSIFLDCSNMTTNISDLRFNNCVKLNNVGSMFYNTKVTGTVSKDIFKDCTTTLSDTSSMFYNSKILHIELDSVNKKGIFHDCITLSTTSDMFRSCWELVDTIPLYLFTTSSDDSYFYNLINTSGMFRGSSLGEGYTLNGIRYLIPELLLRKTPNIKNMSYMFAYIYYRDTNLLNTNPEVQLLGTEFDYLYAVENIDYIFFHSKISGTLPNIFKKSLNTILSALGAFADTRISGTANDLFLDTKPSNGVLYNVQGILAYTNLSETTSGYLPLFSDSSKFTNLNRDIIKSGTNYGNAKLSSFCGSGVTVEPYNDSPYNIVNASYDSTYLHEHRLL